MKNWLTSQNPSHHLALTFHSTIKSKCAYRPVGEPHGVGPHGGCYCSGRANHWHDAVRLDSDMGDRGHDAAQEIKDDVPCFPKMVFNIVPKDPQEPKNTRRGRCGTA